MTEVLLHKYEDRRLRGNDFNEFISQLAALIPKTISRDVLTDSVRNLAGQKLTSSTISDLCWRLAGNFGRLKQQRVVAPWTHQKYLEWVPAQITNVALRRGGRRGVQIGHDITFKVLAGTSCTLSIIQWWSLKKSWYLGSYKDEKNFGFGFVRVWPGKPSPFEYKNQKQLVTLRCLLLIDPELCDDEGPNFKEIAHSSGTTTWNKMQQQYRARLDEPYLCVKKMPEDMVCHSCPAGLDVCRAGTHRETYQLKRCPKCNKSEWFDPADKIHDICVKCVEHNVFYLDEGD